LQRRQKTVRIINNSERTKECWQQTPLRLSCVGIESCQIVVSNSKNEIPRQFPIALFLNWGETHKQF
jgi:hypothetical protein